MWIRLETGWQRDPFVVTLPGASRLVLITLWTLAAERGSPTFDAKGEPEHGELSLQLLEPTFLARECGLDVGSVTEAIETLLRPIAETAWSPEVPARIVVDTTRGVAVVRNLGRYQARAIKDRERKRAFVKAKEDSAELRRKLRNSAEPRRPLRKGRA